MAALAAFWTVLSALLLWRVFVVWPPPVDPPWVEVYPPAIAVPLGGTAQFSARVWNAPDRDVAWAVSEGSITPTGVFTAPSTGNTVVVTASRKSDRSQSGTALIQLVPKDYSGLGLAPAYIESGPSQPSQIHPIPGSTTVARWYCAGPSGQDCEVNASDPRTFTLAGKNPGASMQRFVITAEGTPASAGGGAAPKAGAPPNPPGIPTPAVGPVKASAVVYVFPKDADRPGSAVGQLERDKKLLWLVLLMGALGAMLGASRSFVNYVGNRDFAPSWSFYYFSRPLLGAGLALTVFFAYRIGALTAPGYYSPADPSAAAFIAVMVGLFADLVLGKLHELISVLIPSREPRKDTLTPAQAKPAALDINAVTASVAAQTITITGAGFTAQTHVAIGGVERKSQQVPTPTQIVVPLLPAEVLGAKLEIEATEGGATAKATVIVGP